jgi:hypothetical protein
MGTLIQQFLKFVLFGAQSGGIITKEPPFIGQDRCRQAT